MAIIRCLAFFNLFTKPFNLHQQIKRFYDAPNIKLTYDSLMETLPHHILVADDHPLFRAALVQALMDRLSNSSLTEAENWIAVEKALNEHTQIDLLLLDLCMPGRAGYSGLIYLRSHFPQIPVVIISGIEDEAVINRTRMLGIAAFIPKSAPLSQMITGIHEVLSGGTWFPETAQNTLNTDREFVSLAQKIGTLTTHQHKVFQLIGEGLLNKQIAYELGLSLSTVKAHTTAILKKLEMQRRTQVLAAMRHLSVETEGADGLE